MLCALVVCCIPLFWRWVVRRLMWKVSNRLVVTYLLIGLTPVVLFVTLALVAAYVFSGQFATFAAKAEINRELAHIGGGKSRFFGAYRPGAGGKSQAEDDHGARVRR